jgi:Rieske 2Fe-2S family protein
MVGQIVRESTEIGKTLPSHYYYDPDIYELEKERIFYNSWLFVAHSSNLPQPGDYVVRTIGDESIVITRDRDMRVHAFYNVCRHRGSRLCIQAQGHAQGGALTCRYHGWTYGMNGDLVAIPKEMYLDDLPKDNYPLYRVPVEVWQGLIFINLDPDPETFVADFGALNPVLLRYGLPGLKSGGVNYYDVDSNWKEIWENASECGHCPGVHPELCEVVPIYKTGLTGRDSVEGTLLLDQTMTATGTTNQPMLKGLAQEDMGRFRSVSMYPNVVLAFQPESVATIVMWPDGPNRTKITNEFFFDAEVVDSPDFDPSDTVEFWDLFNKQDFGVCELAHQGVKSRAHKQGVLGPTEPHILRFNRWVMDKLGQA